MHEGTAAPHHAVGARHVVDAVQARLDKNPDAMRTRRETVDKYVGTLKMRMGAMHFLTKTLPKVGDRDGAARARLQPHACDEHRRYQTAPRGDPGVRSGLIPTMFITRVRL